MAKFREWINELFTEPNNRTLCPVRLMAVFGCVQFLTLSAWNFARVGTFDPQAYCVGFAALMGGIGIALGTKKDSQ
jgi:hypothetical protein